MPQISMEDPPIEFKLRESMWFRVASYLYTHELLTNIAGLSAQHLAMFGDEGCWSTLSLPVGSGRLRSMLSLMLVEERTFWVPMLRHVQTIDFDLRFANSRIVDLFRDLLLHGLALDGVLNSISIRNVPVFPQQDADTTSQQQKLPHFSKKDLRLVNPITTRQQPRYPLFLLDPTELGRLRFLLANFRYFRLVPSADLEEASVDFVAKHRPPVAVMDVLEIAAFARGEVSAKSVAEMELRDLRRLKCWDTGSFNNEKWFRLMEPRYDMLLANWS